MKPQESKHHLERRYSRRSGVTASLQSRSSGGQIKPLLQRQVTSQAESIGTVKHITAAGGIHRFHLECGLVFRRIKSSILKPISLVPTSDNNHFWSRRGQHSNGLFRQAFARQFSGE